MILTNSCRTAIKESLLNNPDLDLSRIDNVNKLTDDILDNISSNLINFYNIITSLKS